MDLKEKEPALKFMRDKNLILQNNTTWRTTFYGRNECVIELMTEFNKSQQPEMETCECGKTHDANYMHMDSEGRYTCYECFRSYCEDVIKCAKNVLELHAAEQEGLSIGQPKPEQWFTVVDALRESIYGV